VTKLPLLSNKWRIYGFIPFIAGLIIFLFSQVPFRFFELKIPVFVIYDPGFFFIGSHYFSIGEENIALNLSGILIILGLFTISFTKEKNEDEFIERLRLEAILWAIVINYAILVIAFLFFYGIGLMWVLIYNTITIFLIFIIRFKYLLFKMIKLN